MKEEIRNGNEEIQKVIKTEVERAVGPLRTELADEKANRQALEQRVAVLEERLQSKGTPATNEGEEVDKSIVVVGGFGDKDADEAETFIAEAMEDVPGVEEVYTTSATPKVGFARFSTPEKALKFVKSQKKYKDFRRDGLWASENRSIEERRRFKVASKIKKFLIENEGYEPKHILVDYTHFKVMVRAAGKRHHVATVLEDASPKWHDCDCPVGEETQEAVKDAIEAFDL